MNKVILFALLACAHQIAAQAKTDESPIYQKKQTAVIYKLTQDTRAIQEYATLGRAQCYSMLFGLKEQYNEVDQLEESDLYWGARSNVEITQSPLLSLTKSKALKNHLVNYIKTWQKRPSYAPAYQKGYSINYRETEKCETMFNANNKNLHQSYLKFVRNTDNYEQPKCDPNCNCCTVTPEDIEQRFDNYLKYYIEYVEPDGCPMGQKEWC